MLLRSLSSTFALGGIVCLLGWCPAPLHAAAAAVNVAGTRWDSVTTGRIKVKSASSSHDGLATLYFGRSPAPWLEDNEFLAEGLFGAAVRGSYTADAKGKIAMEFSPADLRDAIEVLVAELAADEGVSLSLGSLSITSQKTSGKVSKGVLKLKLTVRFELSGTLDGEAFDAKGSYTAAIVGD